MEHWPENEHLKTPEEGVTSLESEGREALPTESRREKMAGADRVMASELREVLKQARAALREGR